MKHLVLKCRVAMAFGLLASALAVTVSCMCDNQQEDMWASGPASFNLSKYGKYAPLIEFSSTGEYVCVDWHLTSGSHARERLVLSVHNDVLDVVNSALDDNGRFADQFATEFPKAWPRTSGRILSSHFHQVEDRAALFPYPEFVANAGQWILLDDLRYGLRLVDPIDADSGKPLSITDQSDWAIWRAEYWQFTPVPKRIWRISLPREMWRLGDGNLYTVDGAAYLMLAYLGSKALILSPDDGHLVRTIDYDEYLGDARELVGNNMPTSFSAWRVSFSAEKALLACGGFEKTEFMVISFAGGNQARLAHACMKSLESIGFGGVWHINRVEFGAQGKYLIVEYLFAGRSTDVVVYRTEVYETVTWQEVWSMQSRTRHGLILSPDGKRAAMIAKKGQSMFLEVGEIRIKATAPHDPAASADTAESQ